MPDIYHKDYFLQHGSIDAVSRCAVREYTNQSVLLILTNDTIHLPALTELLNSFTGLDTIYLEDVVRRFSQDVEEKEFGAFAFLHLNKESDTIEFIAQDMPPFLLKKKNGDTELLEHNFNLTRNVDIAKAVRRISFAEVGSLIQVSNKKIMHELQQRHLNVFAKCELEKVINLLRNREESEAIGYFVLNHTLQDRIKFSHQETIPARLENIITFEQDLEKMLKDSYPKEEETNDNALTIFNELILNAYEHGTLGIESSRKQELMLNGTYEDYVEDLEQEINGQIAINVVIYEQNLLKITIKDYGKGFAYTQFDCREKNISENQFHGRGVQMSGQLSSMLYYEDGGSKVSFFIKYELEEEASAYHHSEDHILRQMRVLYVEDDRFIRLQFSKIIQRMVGELFVANDGEEGLEMYRLEQPDIVLTDIEMPHMNGLDMAAAMKEINPDQSIVIMTAYNQDDKFLQAIDIGVDKYVIKPVKITQLKSSLYAIAKQIFFKREAMRLMREQKERDEAMLMELQSQNRYAIAQQTAAFKKQELIIHDDSALYDTLNCQVFYKPLERLSGDIYGVYRLDEHRSLLYIVDSMGKGLAASVTAVLSAAYINRSIDKSTAAENFNFERLLKDYQDYIVKYLLDDECLSYSLVYVDLEERTCRYTSFGMYPVIIKDHKTQAIYRLESNNPPMSQYLLMENISDPINLPESFTLLLFSDGLVETEVFGMSDLLEHMKSGPEGEEIDLFKRVMHQDFEADDDLTLIRMATRD